MSICIKHGLLTKHKYKKGVCLNCGRVRAGKKEIIFATPNGEPKASIGSEPPQTTVQQSVMDDANNCSIEELEAAAELYDRNLTAAYNKDSI